MEKNIVTRINPHVITGFAAIAITLITAQSVSFLHANSLASLQRIDQGSASSCDTSVVTISGIQAPTSQKKGFWDFIFRWGKTREVKREYQVRNEREDEDEDEHKDDSERTPVRTMKPTASPRSQDDNTNNTPYTFSTECLEQGAQIYRDDSRYTFYHYPEYQNNSVYIKTGNIQEKQDARLRWSIKVSVPSNIYLLYRYTNTNDTVPQWISSEYERISPPQLTEDNQNQFVIRREGDNQYGAYSIYQKMSVLPNSPVVFQRSSDKIGGAYSMYVIVIKPLAAATANPTNSPNPSRTPSPSPIVMPSRTPQAVPTPTPVRTAIPTPTRTATPAPTRTPVPTIAPTSTPVATMSPLQIVASHNSQSNCWTVYKGHIYNVTGYFGMHPGGDSNLAKSCGKDMTSGFSGVGSHNSTAISILETYRIQ
jgi:hypothetical protein